MSTLISKTTNYELKEFPKEFDMPLFFKEVLRFLFFPSQTFLMCTLSARRS